MELLSGVRILAVDDSEDTRDVLAVLFGLQGAEVTAVGSASEAMAAIDAGSFDAIVCDISLPDGDGYTLMRSIRQRAGGGAPAVAMTGFGGDEDRDSAAAAGFQRHLTKPIDFDHLASVIAELIGRKSC